MNATAQKDYSEAEMIAGCRAGNHVALEELVKRYQTAVLRVCVSLLGSRDVEDLVQDIFIKILRKIRYFESRSSLFTWIYEITVNHCRDELRRRKRRRWFSLQALPPETVEGIAAEEDSASEQMEAEELRQQLRRALNHLEPKYRELIVLRDLEGLGYEEIAKISGTDAKLVKSRLYQARQILAEKMRNYVEEGSHVRTENVQRSHC
jgi:RNA polymerase sigma-70 factor (ECF subfamily)